VPSACNLRERDNWGDPDVDGRIILTFSRLMTYICRTSPLTSRRYILYIYSTNIRTEYFKHAAHSPFFSLQNAAYFIMLPFFGSCIIHILNTGVLKFKRKFRRLKVKIDLQEVGGGCGDWMQLAQDRDRWPTLVSKVRNLRVPKMRGIS
jgi:hypothetical protein